MTGVFLLSSNITFIIILAAVGGALMLSFIPNTSAITKVFALLLLSAAIVLLWLTQSYFMLIYLVYILAFISAVLMLFIGVVLMLPLSTKSSTD